MHGLFCLFYFVQSARLRKTAALQCKIRHAALEQALVFVAVHIFVKVIAERSEWPILPSTRPSGLVMPSRPTRCRWVVAHVQRGRPCKVYILGGIRPFSRSFCQHFAACHKAAPRRG